MAKSREFPESNYKAVYSNGKTFRFAIDSEKEISPLAFPEFYDVDIFGYGGRCEGRCPYCYLAANPKGQVVKDAVQKIYQFFGQMSDNERPFQVALPGSGEGYLHPEFIDILAAFCDLGIVPNYTTNGMWSCEDTDTIHKLMTATQKYCGGVALTYHNHLRHYFEKSIDILSEWNIKTNLHFIISNEESVDLFVQIFQQHINKFNVAVLLPYGVQGHAKKDKKISWNYLMKNLPLSREKIAFGANFYPYIISETDVCLDLSLYKERDFSKFLDLCTMRAYPSSWEYVS